MGKCFRGRCASLFLIKVITTAQSNTKDQNNYFSNAISLSDSQGINHYDVTLSLAGYPMGITEAITQHSYSISYQIFFLDHSFQLKIKKRYVKSRGK